ncbi:MAG TPA: type II toxin-antitoxin system VapB family antitoxin [Conexibacter sp.]|nr:type II toxin-antitoxin system VapB family antitoxin [Conexibacter sp.]
MTGHKRARTTVNLDLDLVREAGVVLGTKRTTDTLHEALRDVVRRERRDRLARHDFADLTLEQLRDVRSDAG